MLSSWAFGGQKAGRLDDFGDWALGGMLAIVGSAGRRLLVTGGFWWLDGFGDWTALAIGWFWRLGGFGDWTALAIGWFWRLGGLVVGRLWWLDGLVTDG